MPDKCIELTAEDTAVVVIVDNIVDRSVARKIDTILIENQRHKTVGSKRSTAPEPLERWPHPGEGLASKSAINRRPSETTKPLLYFDVIQQEVFMNRA